MDSKIDQILLHLYDCVDYGFSYRLKKGLYISEYFDHWKKEINPQQAKKVIFNLNREKLIKEKKNYDGSIIISLTDKGKLRALNLSFRRFCDKKEKWDGKWRLIAFDIPNECKKGREALTYRFRIGGFYKLQESLFLYPYDCEKEIKALVELFKLQKYVRFGLLGYIDNEEEIKRKMRLS
jgi:DNA-binding transcriptional regulator PaaX